MDLGFDILKSVVIGFTATTNPPTYVARKKPSEHNAKDMNAILCGISKSICQGDAL
jgi:hypothetical protein